MIEIGTFQYIANNYINTNAQIFNMKNYLVFNNIKYREKCLTYLPLIKNIIIPPLVENSDYETVFIDFRWFPHIEYLIRNTIIKLPTWKHTVICGDDNFHQIQHMCSTISD